MAGVLNDCRSNCRSDGSRDLDRGDGSVATARLDETGATVRHSGAARGILLSEPGIHAFQQRLDDSSHRWRARFGPSVTSCSLRRPATAVRLQHPRAVVTFRVMVRIDS